MVGGLVIETIILSDRVWINCQEYLQTQDLLLRDKTAIYVENSAMARSVGPGDIVWWQSDRAMWTAKDRNGKTIGKPDQVLKRIGCSGVKRPTA